MALFPAASARKVEAFVELAFCNPFLARRIDLERKILGPTTVGDHAVMHNLAGLSVEDAFPHLARLSEEALSIARAARTKLLERVAASDRELDLYQHLALYCLYSHAAVRAGEESSGRSFAAHWEKFEADFAFFLRLPGRSFEREDDPAHVLACSVQIRRAFRNVFNYVVGASTPVARLRAAVWESIFTHDLRRYGRALFETLPRVPTLITGQSGTGKELVAKAIALSRYVPFDSDEKQFARENGRLVSVNLSALAPTLVESELFGHVKGAFTGAVRDRDGRLAECGELGSVFLDEIGELDLAIQVKLLRVLQERRYQRLGEGEDRTFNAKILAATNRDLAIEMAEGRFREDLYYRLCGDVVRTPSLREQLDDAPDDLPSMVRYILSDQHLVVDEVERESIANEVVSFIETELPGDYPWPGNFRELEQCVRNILIRREYRPVTRAPSAPGDSDADSYVARLRRGELSSDELVREYYTLVYKKTGSYKAAARVLEIDWRTVRDKVDPAALDSDA